MKTIPLLSARHEIILIFAIFLTSTHTHISFQRTGRVFWCRTALFSVSNVRCAIRTTRSSWINTCMRYDILCILARLFGYMQAANTNCQIWLRTQIVQTSISDYKAAEMPQHSRIQMKNNEIVSEREKKCICGCAHSRTHRRCTAMTIETKIVY